MSTWFKPDAKTPIFISIQLFFTQVKRFNTTLIIQSFKKSIFNIKIKRLTTRTPATASLLYPNTRLTRPYKSLPSTKR